MERMQVSPSGLILRLGAGLWPEVASSSALLFSVHFTWVPMPSTPFAIAGADDANLYYSSPFSSILHESRWEREREARRMMIEIAGNLVVPDDIHFLVHAFCDYSEDVLESFYQQGGSGGDHLYISLLIQIPAAATAAGTTAAEIIGGPYDPPQPPHLPDHAIVGPSDEPSRSRLQLPDIVSYNHLPRMYFPELQSSPVIWGGGDASVDVGNNPASASAVPQLERVVFGAANGSCRETSCAICIDDFNSTSVLSVMPCGHGFHSACLDEWLIRSNSCPLCRSSLPAAN